ncbi:hypothetical protein CKO28_00575 [Rhodovibrio sodomensis]|uniref:Uncharacterized protein n=1 Tax=Rhodovibrio sodomensis TaxID=1088 RepID=A0ABS1D855_9PROT|nr:hypothetical protein [Rhodovibrio sodomensis]MBK1666535.1 hypothetical protein [Rhodovibrio sodomensis]
MSSARDRFASFFQTSRIEAHAPEGGDRTRRATRLAAVLAAGLTAAACSSAPEMGTGPKIGAAPAAVEQTTLGHSSEPGTLDALARVAQAAGGGTVAYVDLSRMDSGAQAKRSIIDNAHGPDGHIAQQFATSVFDNALKETRPEYTSVSFKLTNGTTYCLGVATQVDRMTPGHLLSHGHSPDRVPETRIQLKSPDALAFFTQAHEVAGHCGYTAPSFSDAPNWRQHAEVVADSVAAALLARRDGHTHDIRAISELRAAGVLEFAGQSYTGTDGQPLRSADYYTSPAIDQVAAWADKRLALPAESPDHLKNMPPADVVREAQQIGLKHVLTGEQLDRLQAGLDKAATQGAEGQRLGATAAIDLPQGNKMLARIARGTRATFGPEAAPPAVAFSPLAKGGSQALPPMEAGKLAQDLKTDPTAAATKPRRAGGLEPEL